MARIKYSVIVGNVGTVRNGAIWEEAESVFAEYCEQSKSGVGRAGGESVFITRANGDPVREFIGENESNNGDL